MIGLQLARVLGMPMHAHVQLYDCKEGWAVAPSKTPGSVPLSHSVTVWARGHEVPVCRAAESGDAGSSIPHPYSSMCIQNLDSKYTLGKPPCQPGLSRLLVAVCVHHPPTK